MNSSANGLGGTTLRVNMRTREMNATPTDPQLAREWLGARGFVAKILYDEVPREADPLGPENKLIVAPGILTGAFVPAGSKCGFGAISPATNAHGDSSVGGHFGPELKFAGIDLLVFEDQATEPVMLVIDEVAGKEPTLVSAEKYWGMGALDCEAALKTDLGEDFEIVTIGPAGENLVVFACISHDFGRQAGRCGIGAVMGSKKLKAIAVRGGRNLAVNDLDGLVKFSQAIMERTREHPNMAPWQQFGTAMFVGWSNNNGTFPVRNFQTSYTEKFPAMDGDVLRRDLLVSDKACFGCWMNCGKYSKVQLPGKPVTFVEGPEYETSALCGGNCDLSTVQEVAYANWVCDNLGLDTISGGSVVAFTMECFEKGLITKEDLDGREVHWGSVDDFEFIMNLAAYRKGKIGELIAMGTRKAAQLLGGGAPGFAIQQKGLELSGYESRWAPAMLLSYMTSDIGAHHNRSWAITVDIELGRDEVTGKAPVVVYLQHIRPLFDSLSVCRLFWGELDIVPEEYAEALNLVTGWGTDITELLRISEKMWNLNRAHFLERNGGPGRSHDIPVKRHVEEKVPTGPAAGHGVTMDQAMQMLDEYYDARGWDRDGNPTREVLEDLGLQHAANNLEHIGLLGKPIPGGIPPVRGRRLQPKAF